MANIPLQALLKNRRAKGSLTKASQEKPNLAAIPVVDDPTLQTWIKSIDRGLRLFGNGRLTTNDLIEYGLLEVTEGKVIPSRLPIEEDRTVPKAITNLTANGAYSSITLSWEHIKTRSFGHNAVYRSETDDFGKAVQIGSTIGSVYTDYVGANIRAYYWVRTISKYGVEGDLSPSATAKTSIDITYLLDQLKDKITNNQFSVALKQEIAKIPDIKTSLDTEISNRVSQAEAIALNFLNLQNELTTKTDNNSASILNVQQTLNSKIENVAQEITLISAGVGDQFDTNAIWFFDEGTTEGWTSEGGLPSIANGWIKPFLNGANTTLISPTGKEFSGTAYPHIRFRVKKIGNPVWNGTIAWGSGFSLYVAIDEPTWNLDTGIAVVQKSVEWIGTIGQIKLKLATTQDAENHFMIDWFAFGRPSPAASWAAVGELKTAIANEEYARIQYQQSNEAVWANKDQVYRGLIQEAASIAADETGIVAEKLNSFLISNDTHYAGSEEEYAGSVEIHAGHISEETLRIEGDEGLATRLDQVELSYAENDTTLRALIQNEQNARVSGDEAMAETLNTLAVTVNEDITAAIKEEARVRVEQNTAMAETLETLEVTINEDITAAIQNESTVRANQNSAMANQITSLQTGINGNSIKIEEAFTSIGGIQGEWRVKIDQNGRVSGVSLGVDGAESQFTIIADRFVLTTPSGEIALPFTMDADGKIIIDTALIKNGSIQNAQIANLNADKITAGDIAADRMKTNIVEAVSGKFESLSALTATIGHLRTATTGARTEIQDNLIQVFDSSGRVRVKIGVWEEE